MGQLIDFRTGQPQPGPFSASPDQVVVTYRGDTRTFETYGDLRAAILVDCRAGLDAERDASIARAIAADRRERAQLARQTVGRLAVTAALVGSAMAVLLFVAGA